MSWKTSDGKVEASPLIGQIETLIKGMLNKNTLLDLIRHFIVFEENKKEDKETGLIFIQKIKKNFQHSEIKFIFLLIHYIAIMYHVILKRKSLLSNFLSNTELICLIFINII